MTTIPTRRVEAAAPFEARLATVQLLIGAGFVVSFVAFAVWARFTVPYRDDWDWLLWVLQRPLTVGRFFAPHNEHVIVLERLLLVLQYAVEGTGFHVIFAAALLAQLGTGWICLREIRRRWSDASTFRYVAGVAAVILFFSFQLQSFVFMAATVFPLVQFFATAAIASALTAADSARSRRLWLALSAVACVGAMLTTTSGLVVPLLVALVLWCRRAPLASVTGFLLLTVVGAAGYLALAGLPWRHEVAAGAPGAASPGPGAMLGYFLTFFAAGAAYAHVGAATTIGTALLAAGTGAIVMTVTGRGHATRLEVFAVGLMLFAIASVAMATPARAQFGALQAAQSRYATCSLAYWAGLFVWIVSRYRDRTGPRLRRLVVAVTLAATALAFLPHVAIAMVWKAKSDNIAAALLSLEAGIRDDEWVTTLHPLTSVVYDADRALSQAGTPYLLPSMGARLDGLGSLPACSGTLGMTRIGPGRDWRVSGPLETGSRRGYITDASGVLRGVAAPAPLVDTPSPAEPDVVRVVWQSWRAPQDRPDRWMGFAKADGPQPYALYPLTADGRPACRTELDVSEPVHIWLDQPDGPVGPDPAGAGWAFQCDGAIDRLTLVIDGVEQAPERVDRDVVRPDVAASFAALCEVGAAGFGFSLDTRGLPVGRHEIKARAVGRGGRTADSNPRVIEVTR